MSTLCNEEDRTWKICRTPACALPVPLVALPDSVVDHFKRESGGGISVRASQLA